MRLIIGTRGSQLALAQTRAVRDQLAARHPELEVQVEVIRTQGDRAGESLRSLGGQGAFTSELEDALLEGRIDLAVHSLKDLPTGGPPELTLVATPPREDVRDVLVAARTVRDPRTDPSAGPPEGNCLDQLPLGATVGTGSLRRRAQLLALRPDLRLVDVRGNLDTRIARAETGELDAVALAAAGLHRLGWTDRISAYLEPAQMLPAVGQAALGLQMRTDAAQLGLVEGLNHAATFQAVTAERALLAALGGGCHAPIAAWAREEDGMLVMDGAVGRPDGSIIVRRTCRGSLAEAEALGTGLGAELRAHGAAQILAEPG